MGSLIIHCLIQHFFVKSPCYLYDIFPVLLLNDFYISLRLVYDISKLKKKLLKNLVGIDNIRMEVDLEPDAKDQLKARPYQAQLEEIATENNTIIYLPTG